MGYRIFGSGGSPYSIKVRSYFRFKDIDHVWLVRNCPEHFAEHQKYSKLPLVPTVISPDGTAMQDSTLIIETMEALVPEPSIYPQDVVLRFLSDLLEEFADEWANKWMMHFRWYSQHSGPDAEQYSRRIAVELKSGTLPGSDGLSEQVNTLAAGFKERMLGRGFTVGSNEKTQRIIEASYVDSIVLLNTHLRARPYLFGRRPCLADFGLAGQLYQCFQDVTAGELMRLHAPSVADWVERMVNPRVVADGTFESWDTLASTLEPFLQSQVVMFLCWSNANARTLSVGSTDLSVDLGVGQLWQQTVGSPQRYHAKSLKELQRKFQAVFTDKNLVSILQRCGCLQLMLGDGTGKL